MSYEGYTQSLCKRGHYWTTDCFFEVDLCPICGEPSVWDNMVDETNGCAPIDDDGHCQCGHIDLVAKPPIYHNVCPHCKKAESVEITYSLPADTQPHRV